MKNAPAVNPKRDRDVRNAVSNIVSYIKESTANNLVEAARMRKIDINPDQLRQVVALVNGSIEEGFTRSSGEIESALRH
jgi:hypothetical protein